MLSLFPPQKVKQINDTTNKAGYTLTLVFRSRGLLSRRLAVVPQYWLLRPDLNHSPVLFDIFPDGCSPSRDNFSDDDDDDDNNGC